MIRVSSRKELRDIELPMLWDLQIHSQVRDPVPANKHRFKYVSTIAWMNSNIDKWLIFC